MMQGGNASKQLAISQSLKAASNSNGARQLLGECFARFLQDFWKRQNQFRVASSVWFSFVFFVFIFLFWLGKCFIDFHPSIVCVHSVSRLWRSDSGSKKPEFIVLEPRKLRTSKHIGGHK